MLRDYLVSRSRLFKKLDADGNGAIDTKELQAALQGAGAASISLDECEQLLKESDKDGSGTIEINELLVLLTKGTLFDGVDLQSRLQS